VSINFETYLEARRIERELRDKKLDRLKRLGPLPEREPSNSLLRRWYGGLNARTRGLLSRARQTPNDVGGTSWPRPVSGLGHDGGGPARLSP
jgi:hypothetical protein